MSRSLGGRRSMTPRTIGLVYLAFILAFAVAYFFMPETDFYHGSIQYEPSARDHLRRLQDAIDSQLGIKTFKDTPSGLRVGSSSVNAFSFTRGGATFDLSYYYYVFAADEREWSDLVKRCGKSERDSRFYRRTVDLRVMLTPSGSGRAASVHAKTQ